MGCDIHCYIEYRRREIGDENPRWQSHGGRINPGRNYALFGLLAGIRLWDNNEKYTLFKAKGFPKDAGYWADDENYIYIDDEGGPGKTSMKRASEWVKHGCHFKNGADGKPTWVSNPDWHTHSWLTLKEFEKALNKYWPIEQEIWDEREKDRKNLIMDVVQRGQTKIPDDSWLLSAFPHDTAAGYQAVAATMACFEKLGFETRLVFWFDN